MNNKLEIAGWLLNPDNPLVAAGDLAALEKKIKENGLEKIYREIELPLAPILAQMSKTGIKVDVKILEKLSKELGKELAKLESGIYKKVGGLFNLNSPKQLSEVLFERLKISDDGVRKTKTGLRSTDAAVLSEIQGRHPVIAPLLKYRELFKVKSTYVDPLLELGLAGKENRIHTTFLQTGTATGRLSSQNPNLQNIPIAGEWGKKIREAFVAEDGYELVALDYSQIELRVLATVAKDPKMIEAFQNNLDIHAITAANVFNTDIKKISKDQRRFAKTLNFGVIYGMGPNAFARSAGISVAEARKFIDEYFSDFSSIKDWQKKLLEKARAFGYVETLNGRKRWLPQLLSQNRMIASEAERAAINMPIQGLAADVIKMTMIEIDGFAKKENWNDKVKMLLTIHDELIFEIKKDFVKKAMPILTEIMESAYELAVPLKVDMSSGKNWSELK